MSAGVSDQRMKGKGNQGMFGPSFGQQSSYNFFPGNGDYNNQWDSQQVNAATAAQSSSSQQRKDQGQDDYEYYGNRGGNYSAGHGGIRGVEQGMRGLGLDINSSSMQQQQQSHHENKINSRSVSSTSKSDKAQKEIVPKQMTWASIASQPAKPQIRANSSSSALKKKGPGMPPPPMVPGKHNMDIGTWDSPSKNGSLVPPPPPVITAPPPPSIEQLSNQMPSKSNQNNNSNNSANSNSGNGPQMGPNSAHPSNASGSGGNNVTNQHHNMSMPHGSGTGHHNDMRPSAWSSNQNNDRNGGPSHMGMMGNANSQHPNSQQGPPPPHQQTPHPMSMINNYQRQSNQQPSSHMNHPSPMQQHHHQNNSGASMPAATAQPKPKAFPAESDLDNVQVLEELLDKNNYNPPEIDMEKASNARFFVIKSYSEDDIHRSIKYEIWCSTEHGNNRLDQAYREREKDGGIIYLFFSVNGSGHFCGMAQMMTAVDYSSVSSVWAQDKWKGTFKVKWIYVKDVPNTQLRQIRLENNENKPVTNSRDAQEVPNDKGVQVLRILHAFKHTTSIFDDFFHYEKRQEEEVVKKEPVQSGPGIYDGGPGKPPYQQGGGYDRPNYCGGYDRGGAKGYGQYGGNHGGRGGGGYHGNYDNRRIGNDDGYSRGYDRPPRGNEHGDGGGSGFTNRDNDYQRNNRSDYRDKRDDRGGFMSRDRDNGDGGFGGGRSDMGRDRIGGGSGGSSMHREYRDRTDQAGNRGRGSSSSSSGGIVGNKSYRN